MTVLALVWEGYKDFWTLLGTLYLLGTTYYCAKDYWTNR